MKYFSLSNIHTIIDIGTTKICVIIAQQTPENTIDILGIGITNSQGLSKGVVVDVPRAAESIKIAIQEAQSMASVDIDSAFIGISGSHIKSYYSQGMVSIKNSLIQRETIDEALHASRAIILPEDHHILHVVPMGYIIDGVHNVQNPLGMHGMRLEVMSHIITANINSVHDLIHCCKIAGIKTQEIVLEPIASGHAILNDSEKQLGALLVDIGGGTADVALYQKGALHFTEILPIAGTVFTNDLAVCLRTSISEAERLKKQYGIMCKENHQCFENICIESLDGFQKNEIPHALVHDILYARSSEFITLLHETILRYQSIYNLPSGIVLTGGGSLLAGLPELTTSLTNFPTRIGSPSITTTYKGPLEHPSYATSYGLMVYAFDKYINKNLHQKQHGTIFTKMASWFNELWE